MIDNINLKGIVTLTLRDSKTLEIISERTETNQITWYGMEQILTGNDIDLTMVATTIDYADIRGIGLWNDSASNAILQSSTIQGTTLTVGNPSYFERIARFNQPGSTRFLYNILYGTNTSSDNKVYTKVRLNPPCEQTDTQVLDITYRIQFEEFNSPNVSSKFGELIARKFMRFSRLNGIGVGSPIQARANWHKPPVVQYQRIQPYNGSNDLINQNVTESEDTDSQRDNIRLRKVDFNIPLTQADDIGKVFGCLMYGITESTNTAISTTAQSMSIYAKPVPTGFANVPIQPLHNHNTIAQSPFLDVNNLATGPGTINLNGDSWTNPDYPKYTRIDIKNDGDVGTARYSFKQRNTVGFSGNSYYPTDTASIGFQYEPVNRTGFKTIEGGHGLIMDNQDYNKTSFNGRTIVSNSSNGITLIDIIDGTYTIFDSTTTPSLNLSNITKLMVDNNNIWIIDDLLGLYKISDVLVSPSITHINNSSNGIPVNGDTKCYAISKGINNIIWAAFDGGLSSSTDGGLNWTNYDDTTVHPFLYIGITDNNWDQISGITVDPESTTSEMGILLKDGSLYKTIWWSTSDVVSDGPTDNKFSAGKDLTCSKFGGLWQLTRDWTTGNTSQQYAYRLKYGTTALDFFAAASNNRKDLLYNNQIFFYDYYNSPYICTVYDSIDFGVFNADRKYINSLSGSNGSTHINTLKLEDSNGVGKGLYIAKNKSLNIGPLLKTVAPSSDIDPLNIRYSIFEEELWTNYQWNGSAWEANYHAVATDTSGNNTNHGIRHNFDVEDHKFTGRSIIDITSVFTTNTLLNTGSFIFTLNPDDKLSAARTVASAQEQESTIFEFNDNNGNRLILEWDNGGNIVLSSENDTQVIVITPTSNSTYRVAVVLTPLDVKLYLDGTLTGTLTLTSPIDLSNQSSNMESILGARTHAFNYNNRRNIGNFYRGIMNNIQLWNIEWDQTDVTNDMLDITSVIISKPAINLISRYELTQSLIGLETKVSHIASEELLDGVTIDFTDGPTSPAFIEDEYYTVGIVDGILKDNATSITFDSGLYLCGDITKNFSDITTESNNTNVLQNASGTSTEKLIFNHINDGILSNIPGELTTINSTANIYVAWSIQSTIGDMSITFKPVKQTQDVNIGFSNGTLSNSSSTSQFLHFLKFKTNGQIDLQHGNTIESSNITTYTLNDSFTIERVGTTVSFYKTTNSITQLLFTSATTSSGSIYTRINPRRLSEGVYEANVTYSRPDLTMSFGNSVNSTGLYDPIFIGFDNPVELYADGISLDITYTSNQLTNLPVVAPGTAVYNTFNGVIKLNNTEIGKSITGSVLLIKDLPK